MLQEQPGISKRRFLSIRRLTYTCIAVAAFVLGVVGWQIWTHSNDRTIAGLLEQRGVRVVWETEFDDFGTHIKVPGVDCDWITAADYIAADLPPPEPPLPWRVRRYLRFHKSFPRVVQIEIDQAAFSDGLVEECRSFSDLLAIKLDRCKWTETEIKQCREALADVSVGYGSNWDCFRPHGLGE